MSEKELPEVVERGQRRFGKTHLETFKSWMPSLNPPWDGDGRHPVNGTIWHTPDLKVLT